ncbi:type-F conjugative transfer system protein TrbI (plasmid) [Edwardsiella tarda]|uniref:type-F conjugative transfer system protein TrbI n=1 Tax=Edwardsiella tarda TaxID=636 RepID=UPI000D52384D|nr:type-F conjugative transfer system protein TrbI [Edwardsiella tarda]UCQ29564.1 type-F conjugative transfer system protein TrbI [Edwardsiella tarda]
MDSTALTLSRPRRRKLRCLKPVAIAVGCLLALNAGIALLLAQWVQPVTVSFDMAGTVNSFMAQAAQQSLDNNQMTALTARFNTALSASLTDYQRRHRAVILVSAAVVGGAEDITAQIQQAVAEQMAQP